MSEQQIGAIIEQGPADWQILQQDDLGSATLALAGRWVGNGTGRVEVRVVFEDTGAPVGSALDWQAVETLPDGSWRGALANVPAGGLYRLETRFRPDAQPAGEWSVRGDMRHFLGVGDLWVIAGQSNSAGYGRGPYYDPPELGVHLFGNNERWSLATHPMNESTETKHIVNREASNPGHSPYLHFARVLKRQLGYPIGLVQTALGGSALSPWNPTERHRPVLFENMAHCVERVGGRVKGVIWYQGESDTGDEASARSYEERFINAVGAWRKILNIPSLCVVTVQINRWCAPADEAQQRRWSQVREAQRQIPRRLAGVVVVPSLDLQTSDEIHTSPAGNMILGERMAAAALGEFYGRQIYWRAPEVQSAKLVDDGKTVVLFFQHVTSRIASIEPFANPFRVEDETGVVPIAQVVYPQDATVRLVLGRAVSGRAVVHGAFGQNPPTVPMDMERLMPMLGFYGVPLE